MVGLQVKAAALAAILAGAMLAVAGVRAAAQQESGSEAEAPARAPVRLDSTADHRGFRLLQGPFASGPEVTRACLRCHTEAARQVQASIHWTWRYEHPTTGQILGKTRVINSFCGNLVTNERRCTSCHAGYGWDAPTGFDFTDQTAVDCLVCHDTTGTYAKWPDRAGHPIDQPVTVSAPVPGQPAALTQRNADGTITYQPPDLAHIAREIGRPGLANCGACHFHGGGGDNVKHGDLSSALLGAPRAVDVHMSPEGAGLLCTDCHTAHGHAMPGSRYLGTVRDGRPAVPGFRRPDVVSCDGCHGTAPHEAGTLEGLVLNRHGARIACQTCHIPRHARGGVPTKIWWDWSEAGRLKDGKPYAETGPDGNQSYATLKGAFRWGSDLVPDYAFWNGVIAYTLLGDPIDPDGVVPINSIGGGPQDADARLYPFKLMRGRQPYDTERRSLVLANLYGPGSDTAFWGNFDWTRAIEAGMEPSGVPFSGSHGFVETQMWWPLSHMVAPARDALRCGQCHAADGRLAGVGGFHLPGRDGFGLVDRVGLGLLALALLAVGLHALGRIAAARLRRRGHGEG